MHACVSTLPLSRRQSPNLPLRLRASEPESIKTGIHQTHRIYSIKTALYFIKKKTYVLSKEPYSKKSPTLHQKSPVSKLHSTGIYQKSPIFFQKSPIVKRALCSIKRALISNNTAREYVKSAPYSKEPYIQNSPIFKRALHSIKRALYPNSTALESIKSTCILSTKPNILYKQAQTIQEADDLIRDVRQRDLSVTARETSVGEGFHLFWGNLTLKSKSLYRPWTSRITMNVSIRPYNKSENNI